MNNISAIIVAKHNPPHLLEAMKSVEGLSDEIVILDIGLTQEMIQKLNMMQEVKIIKVASDITYVEQIREETKKYATYEYVLFLDPDEVVPEKLKMKILEEYEKYDYISMPRKNIMFGKWMQHSRWWPDYQIRLFRKDKVMWPKKLHAQPDAQGIELKLDPEEELALVHYNYNDLTEYFEKMIRYAKSEAGELSTGESMYELKDAVTKGIQEFMSRYFAGQGYMDGMHGFVLAFLQMMYPFFVYFYFWENKNYQAADNLNTTADIKKFFKQGLLESNHWMKKEGHVKQNFKDKIIQKLLK